MEELANKIAKAFDEYKDDVIDLASVVGIGLGTVGLLYILFQVL